MNQIQIFNSPQFGDIRIAGTPDNPLFCAIDVARALGYARPADAITTHCKGVSILPTPTNGGIQQMKYITEPNVYRLIFKSNAPNAEAFNSWVAEEVLPSIRKHGAYLTPDTIERAVSDPDFLISLANTIKEERRLRMEAESKATALQKKNNDQQLVIDTQSDAIRRATPKVRFADAVGKSDDTISIDLMAKLLAQNGIKIGEKRLFAWLREYGYISDQKSTWNRPYQKYVEMGLFRVETSTWKDTSTGSTHVSYIPRVTVKGQKYFVSKFLKNEPVPIFGVMTQVQ